MQVLIDTRTQLYTVYTDLILQFEALLFVAPSLPMPYIRWFAS